MQSYQKPDIPVCGCGGPNKPLYELKNLIESLERQEQERQERERRGHEQKRMM